MVGEKFLWSDFFTKKSEVDVTVVSTLKANKLFKRLSPREIAYVAKVVHMRHYEPNDQVFAQYEKGLGMYMIAKGAIEIRLRAHNADKSDPETLVADLTEGSFFGELALIDDNDRRTASAYAKGPTTLVGFFKPDLMEIMERKPDLGVKILLELSKVLGKRLAETIEQIGKDRGTKGSKS
jgi:CRP-like cAMP-binding protein